MIDQMIILKVIFFCNPLVTQAKKKLSITCAKLLFLLAPAVGIEPTTN